MNSTAMAGNRQKNISEITVSFVFAKGDGEYPDFSKLPESKRNMKYIRTCMTFLSALPVVKDGADEMHVTSIKIQSMGLRYMRFIDGCLIGSPSPTVRYKVANAGNVREFRALIMGSSYRLKIPRIGQSEPFYFEDHNGYSKIIRKVHPPIQGIKKPLKLKSIPSPR